MVNIGILSDTHRQNPDQHFLDQCGVAFSECEAIIHAGDLTDISILSIFGDKKIYAVRGNMCNLTSQRALPERKKITIEGYSIGITHGAGPRHNIEERVFEMFPDVDCIVYGHTHIPVCHKFGHTLLINPGSFQSTGPYGDPGSYGILTIDENGLSGKIFSLTPTQ